MSDWKSLELLVAKIQRQLAPEAVITHNDKILGKTGTPRQIDVSIRSKVGQFELLVALDCKDYAVPADVKTVEEFLGLLEDVGAHKGALVCPKGFTGTAKKRAELAGLDLFSPVDTDPHKWQVKLSVPVVCDFRKLQYQLSLVVTAPVPFRIAQDPSGWEVFDRGGHALGRAVDMLGEKWNVGAFDDTPGVTENVDFLGQPIQMDNGYGQLVTVRLTATLAVSQELFFGLLPIEKMSGFKDELRGGVITNALTTGKLDFWEVEEKWQKIEKLEAAPRVPVFVLVASDVYPA